MATESIRFERRGPLAVLTLNRPESLNALTLEMVQELERLLRELASEPGTSVIVLQGAGEKSFCAGGDVKQVVQPVPSHTGSNYPLEFFTTEYRLDYLIHVYPKPIVVLGHGLIMGGGLGLMAGASCRIVTESAHLAMPEIAIGLYPDVGGTYFLSRLPGHLGLFFGLTAARLNAIDAVHLKLADFMIPEGDREAIIDELSEVPWGDDPAQNRVFARKTAQNFAARVRNPPVSELKSHLDEIESLIGAKSLREISRSLRDGCGSTDSWIAARARAFVEGCPTSAAIMLEQWKRGRDLTLADCFRLELDLSLNSVAGPNFREGVRARLVDKDQKPRWTPATVEEINPTEIQSYFESPWKPDEHPFRDLEKTAPQSAGA